MSFLPACTVTGTIIAGTCDFPTEPTYTEYLPAVGLAGAGVLIPDAARYVDVLLVNSTAANIYGAGAPVVSARSGTLGLAVPQLIRDYTNGIMIPPHPAPISGFPDGDADPELEPTLTVDTTVDPTSVMVTFYLEF